MWPYYCVFFGIILNFLVFEKRITFSICGKKKSARLSWILSFVMMTALMGFRFEVGADYRSYAWIFRAVKTRGIDSFNYIEKGFRIVSFLIGKVFYNVYFYFLILAFLIMLFYALGIREQSSNSLVSVVVFVGMGYYFYAMNQVRQFVAVAMLFWANKYIKKDWKRYCIIVLAASVFHTSALAMIPATIIMKMCKNKHFYLLSGAFAVVMYFAGGKLLAFAAAHVYWFSKIAGHTVTAPRLSFMNLLLGGTVFALGWVFCRHEEQMEWKLKMCWLALVIFVGLAPLGTVAVRLAFYFSSIYLIIIPDVIRKISGGRERRLVMLTLMIICFIYMNYVVIKGISTGQNFYPYRSILSAPESGEYMLQVWNG